MNPINCKVVRLLLNSMQKHILPLFWCFIIFAFSVKPTKEEIRSSSPEEVSVLDQQPKPVLADLYTDWCQGCKVMDKKTYGNQKIIDYVGDNYGSEVNGETREGLSWAAKTYYYYFGNGDYLLNTFQDYKKTFKSSW
jgi:hypothetical protein